MRIQESFSFLDASSGFFYKLLVITSEKVCPFVELQCALVLLNSHEVPSKMVRNSWPNQTFWRFNFNLWICRVLALFLFKFTDKFHSGRVKDCINYSLLKSVLHGERIIVCLQDDKITEGGGFQIFNVFGYKLRLLEELRVTELDQIFSELGTHKETHARLVKNPIQICLFVA